MAVVTRKIAIAPGVAVNGASTSAARSMLQVHSERAGAQRTTPTVAEVSGRGDQAVGGEAGHRVIPSLIH